MKCISDTVIFKHDTNKHSKDDSLSNYKTYFPVVKSMV